MKAGLIALASALVAGAIPADKVFPFDGAVESLVPPPVDGWTALQGGVANLVGGGVKKVTEAILSAFKAPATIFRWRGFESERELEFIQHGDITYELIHMPKFPDHQIRLKSPSLCDPSVKQYSGYFDIAGDKHLFFWFFEAREAEPKEAPLALWLNGGPGCSSIGGLLFELGPCSINHGGKDTQFNKYSWNTHANMIFLDQPINVGYSYSEKSTVDNTPTAAEDVWVFLELFLNRFREYSELPFHLAAESYGGRYAPLIASAIYKHNQELAFAPVPDPALLHINLASVILANGLTEPYTQFSTIPEYACEGPYPVYDDPEGPQCQALRSKVPTCQRLVQSCYAFNSRFTCVPAALYCWSQLLGPFQGLGLNPYDVRRKCDKSKDGDLCYKEMGWIETYANNATVKHDLGVGPGIEYKFCNTEVNQAFMGQGDAMHNSASVLPELLESGVRLLVYAGNADFMCNFIGNFEWMLRLKSPFQEEFGRAETVTWKTIEGKVAGEVRAVGGFGAGNFTYVQVYESGHMVPFDQPEAALDLFDRWITNTPLTHV